jgi:pimeloyl-ACP methyl ester carboxylesterase
LLFHGQRDYVRSWFGLSAHKIPIIGRPGTVALLATQDAYDNFPDLLNENFVNQACARIAIRADKFRPVTYLPQVECPVLLQICEQDTFTPLKVAKRAEKRLPSGSAVKYYATGHFDIYFDQYFENSIKDQLTFLDHLLRERSSDKAGA